MVERLLRPVRSALRGARSLMWHRGHWQEAKAALRAVEADRGPTDPALVASANRYAREVLGWSGYAPWLRVYAAVAGEFREGWIPDNYFGHVVLPAMDLPHGEVSKLKTFARQMFGDAALPDVLYQLRGSFFAPEGRGYRPVARDDVAAELFARTDRVVFKPDGSGQGKDIVVFDAASFRPERLESLRTGVFQAYVQQHPSLEPFSPQSVATLRLTTIHEGGGRYSVRQAFMRGGRAEEVTVRSTSSLRIGVELDTGRFHADGYDKSWSSSVRHPDTGVAYGELSMPAYDACRDLALALHAQVPHVTCIGWDLAVDRDGRPILLEWNGTHNGIKFSEAVQGPCFADLGWESLWRAS